MSIVAAIQMNSSDDLDENIAVANDLITAAANEGAKLIVLPENFAYFAMQDIDKLSMAEDFVTGISQQAMSIAAKQHKVWILGGTIPIITKNNKTRAASILWDEQGTIVARYDKIHLFDACLSNDDAYRESDSTQAGNEIICADTPYGKLGISVCYDLRFPELYRQQQIMGCELIAVPSAFTKITGEVHWEVLLRARAIENLSYVIASNQTGTHINGRQTFGNSMIIDPWGRILAKSNDKVGFVYAEIDLQLLYSLRKQLPVINARKQL